MNQQQNKVLKVVLVGDGGVGKTSYIKRYITGHFETKHIATVGIESNPITLHTNKGIFRLNVWDCAGMEVFGGMRTEYYHCADAAIIMFSSDNKTSLESVGHWYQSLRTVCPAIPIILVCNKTDLPKNERKITSMEIIRATDIFGTTSYPISVKVNGNLQLPFLQCIRSHMNDSSIQLIESPPISVPSIDINKKSVIDLPRVRVHIEEKEDMKSIRRKELYKQLTSILDELEQLE